MSDSLPDLTLDQYEKYNPVMQIRVGETALTYSVPNNKCAVRVQTLLSKEPSTIEWLDSLPLGATLLDVGANVGMYTIYAAVLRRARVYAFEPEAQNYATLCRNIVLNNVQLTVLAWCAALSDVEAFDRLYLRKLAAGSSLHSFGDARDPYLRESTFPFIQGCFSTTIDKLIAMGAIEIPTYIKVDVDGFEHKVMRGAAELLRNPLLKSLSIEINPALKEHQWIIGHMGECGFRYDKEQVKRVTRTEGYFRGVAEYVFRR